MEGLCQTLQEQQLKLQKQQEDLNGYLRNMEKINNEQPPLSPPRKYISIFHIDGEPILPPLMTTEKRRLMQKFKEKAIKIEKNLQVRYVDNEDRKSETSRSSHCNTGGNLSQRSQESYETKLRESEESINMLKNLIKRQEGGASESHLQRATIACSTTNLIANDENLEKMQKLKKSEILIYDNSTNEVIQVPAPQIKNPENEENKTSLQPKKPSHLLLAGVNGEGLTTIPTICLNPPTPLTTVNKPISDSCDKTENSQALTINDNSEKFLDLSAEPSSEDSCNSMRTRSDRRLSKTVLQNIADNTKNIENYASAEQKSVTPNKNVSAKIQQFEAISSDSTTPQSSPEKKYKTRKECLGTINHSGTMNRSATSPSIKLSVSNRSSSSRSQNLAQDSDNSPENSLVRSSSFTLEGPSKALIDHMRQQKTMSEKKSTAAKSPTNSTRITMKKPISSPLRAYRDTVESKAKKVQKVELKSSKQKLFQKTSQSKLSPAAAVASTSSPYTTNALTATNSNNLYKIKKSPYDPFKTSHSSMQTIQKPPNTQMRKSHSTSSNLSQSRTSKLRTSSSSTMQQTPKTAVASNLSNKSTLPFEMGKVQKEKFQRLLAQQEEEQRKLQRSFEMQQKLFLEQLNREMITAQLRSPTNSNSSYNSTPHNHKNDQLNLIGGACIPRSERQTTSSIDSKPHKPLYKQQSSPTLSNSKKSSRKANSKEPTTYIAIHFPQTPQTPQTPQNTHSSHLSSIDYSNANTSLDISSALSIQTSPATMCSTPNTTIQTSANNGSVKSNTSSRRRLFSTEIDSPRSTASSSYMMGQRTGREQMQQRQQQPQPQLNRNNTNSSIVATNSGSSSRRQDEEYSLVLHAAATKINAYARGFLVRRLFRTEQIQRLVQTIRDTLIFVLNLHLEAIENPAESLTPANIKLKARLLQQLSSACRTLHLVFFQSTVKERMEIIARDRKRIQSKLLSMNRKRTHRIVG